jgi:hypothetical protein
MGVTFSISRQSGRGPWISAEASCPKLAYGHNVGVLDPKGAEVALSVFAEAIATLPFSRNLPSIDEWRVSRMDLSHAWRVSNPSGFIADVSRFARGRIRSKEVFASGDHGNGMTLMIDPRGKKRILYDKGQQIKTEIANQRIAKVTDQALLDFSDGVIKFESRANRRRIREVLFKNDMRASHLELYLRVRSLDDLRKDLHELVRSWRPTNESEAIARLHASFKPLRARALFGVYAGIQQVGIDEYRKKLVTNSELLRRDLSDLENAGVGFGDIAHTIELDIPSELTVWCSELNLRGLATTRIAA